MHVAICDADRAYCAVVAKTIRECAYRYDSKLIVHRFSNQNDLWASLDKGIKYIAVFLDIDLDECNGFELGKSIKAMKSDIKIVFVTDNMDYTMQGYSLPAFRYISKPQFSDEIDECISCLLKQHYLSKSSINLVALGLKGEIHSDTVEYVVRAGTGSQLRRISTKGEDIFTEVSIDDLEEMLRHYRFIRIQKSYLTNSKHILKLSNNRAVTPLPPLL